MLFAFIVPEKMTLPTKQWREDCSTFSKTKPMANDDTEIRRIPHSKVAKVWARFGSRGPQKMR